jgi:hypothetical protein
LLAQKKRTKEKGSLKSFFGLSILSVAHDYLFISFAPPKEMNQRKGGRK